MEAATTRMASRSSARHGPAAQFTGKVRKWQKKWTKTGVADRLQVYKWVPLAPGQAGEQGTEEGWEADPNDRQRSVPLSVLLASAKDEKERLAREAAEKVAAEERARVAAQEAQKQAEVPPAAEVVEIPADGEAAPAAASLDEGEARHMEAGQAMESEPRDPVGSPAPGDVPDQAAAAETALEDDSREPAAQMHMEEVPPAAPSPVDAAVAREIGNEQAEAGPAIEADGQGVPASHVEDIAVEQQEVDRARDEIMEEAEEQEEPESNPGTSSEAEDGRVVWKDDTRQGGGAADAETGEAGPAEAPPLETSEQQNDQGSPSAAKALDSSVDMGRESEQGLPTDQIED